MTYRRIDWRPRGYEIFTLVNFLAILALTWSNTHSVITSMPSVFITTGISFLIQITSGVAIRFIFGVVRGGWREYLRVITRPAWLLESVRLMVTGTLVVHTYCWIKLVIPLVHPRLYDAELWNLDRVLFFGISPNIFTLNLLANPYVLHTIDLSYSAIFLVSLEIGFAYFLSAPSRRLRIAFITGNSIMWLIGAWLYMLIPSLGPAYRFPDVWLQYSAVLNHTQGQQGMLWKNYAEILKLRIPGASQEPINIFLGIAAFPSLHVAFQTFVFLWFRRLWTWGEVTFALFVFVIFLGSMITGWHYMIDGLAGLLLAWLVWAATARRYGIVRFTHLSRVV